MRSTNKFDKKGLEIFEGDKVLMAWSWFPYKGEQMIGYQIHTVVVKPAHAMAFGQMHDDGGGIIFCLGETYNFWEGKDVRKLTEQDVIQFGVPEDTCFFIYQGKTILYTDQHLLQMDDAQWEQELKRRKELFYQFEENLFYGKQSQ